MDIDLAGSATYQCKRSSRGVDTITRGGESVMVEVRNDDSQRQGMHSFWLLYIECAMLLTDFPLHYYFQQMFVIAGVHNLGANSSVEHRIHSLRDCQR